MLLPRRVCVLLVVTAVVVVSGLSSTGTDTATDVPNGGPAIIDASYRLHYIDVLNTRHEHSDDDQRYTAQHGGDSSQWSYDTAVVSVSFDDALYLNSTALADVLYFVSLAPANRQILYGLTRLVCPGTATGNGQPRVIESFPPDPEAVLQAAINSNDTDSGTSASIAAAVGDAYDSQRSVLHQSGAMLWPLASAQWSTFTWLHALTDTGRTGGSGGGYHMYNRLEWAVLLGYTTPNGQKHTFIQPKQLSQCRIEFLPKDKQTSDWWAAQELTNRAGDAAIDSAFLSASHFAPKHQHVVSQHSDDVSFLEESTEVGGGAASELDARVGIPGLSVLISALVDEILGPDVKRVADFVTVRLDHRLLGLLAKYVGGSEIPGVYKLWNLLEVDQKITPYKPNGKPASATLDSSASASASDTDDEADGDFAGWDASGEQSVMLDLSAPPAPTATATTTIDSDSSIPTVPTADRVASELGLIKTGRGGKPLTAVQQKAAERMASPLNPLNIPLRSATSLVESDAAATVSAGGGASAAAMSESMGGVAMTAEAKTSLRALAKRYKRWHAHTSLPSAFVPRFPQVWAGSELLSHSGTRASASHHLKELDEPDGIMTRNIITALAKLLTVTVSVALTESLTEALNEDMRDLILPPLREYLPVRMTPIVTRGLVQPLVISLTETITNGVERIVPAVVLSRLKHTLIHTLTRGVTHALAPTLMYTLRDASHLEPVCYSCYYVDRSYCDMCSYLRRRQDRLAPAYHDLYFVDYFTSFYTDHYADWFTYGINPKDPEGTFVPS